MARVLIHHVDEAVKERLRKRALRHKLRLEDEIRIILRAAAYEDPPDFVPLGTRVAELFAGLGLTTEIQELRGQTARPADFKP